MTDLDDYVAASLEPAHIILLRGALATRPSLGGRLDTPDTLTAAPCHPNWALGYNARRLRHWARITRPVREFAELSQLPLGLVLLAMGKGV